MNRNDFVEAFYAFYFFLGMLGCSTQAFIFSFQGKLFDEIIENINANAQKGKFSK